MHPQSLSEAEESSQRRGKQTGLMCRRIDGRVRQPFLHGLHRKRKKRRTRHTWFLVAERAFWNDNDYGSGGAAAEVAEGDAVEGATAVEAVEEQVEAAGEAAEGEE